MFKKLQQIGKAFMLPIAILPAAGLLLGIGGALSNQATVQAYPILNNPALQSIFKVMSGAGGVVFSNLALLLCIGLGIGLAKRDKGVAALASVVGYLIMTGTIAVLIPIFSPEVKGIDTGVIGALVMGLITVKLHNQYHNIQLPQILGFFGGSRFVPIVTAFAAIFVGSLFFLIWPTFQNWLLEAGKDIAAMGEIGTFFYGFLMRLSGAVGLHHMIYPLFWYTELGGTEIVNGETIIGAQKIFFAQLADPNHQGLFTEGTRFFAGRFDTMMFGLPAACLAMYHAIPKQKRNLIGGLFLGAALTSFITGITEPIEFMFLFVAPWLYVFHAFLDGVSFYIADFLNISIGNTFSGGFIDFFLFGILQGNAKTNWITVVMVGLPWAALYYFSFLFLIRKFNVMTPGRGDDQEEIIEQKETSLTENAHKIIEALGKAENIENVDACITRLRVSVKDVNAVNKAVLKSLGAIEVLEVGGGIQAIFGAKAVLYKSEVNQILGRED
ncbi:PTS transporter subunit EIIC [Pasteurella atlantica]|uniref:PTS transporter subunit EIIC n=1 Tax=Pasteurellaceae TaxID=712 RepID=UPI00276C67D7|nr:PTS transporter subunit EIIC [Pasteurella atlantica]MDP8034084.1 PTS transporter subunit EIIC [Pasteurella atlantica]MDP8036010.1 PTS transporter subunit EIIC [Pasteurella atlantica]MDP8037960.1 PTS transporter subunit EIIC [Pasteurella atlantica]MDP8048322.1 PTS transporter subunit EIIC [Pasteurella atlantica]MDP8050272.1 PTS transporter subunit EIIC [Pasteurella atlantica]